MSIPTQFLTTTCDIYRPFGAGSATTSNVPCRLVENHDHMHFPAEVTHYVDLQPGVDIRDGCTRTAGAAGETWADGDEVRIPSGGSTRYVVVCVVTLNRGTAAQHQRVFLLRHVASWPDP